MNNQLELYVNKKFDINKIIKMVLKRKGWGENYTLYSTPTHEVIASMVSFNFEDKYATFRLRANEKGGSGYESYSFNIYTDRKDYTLQFINLLLLRSIKSCLESMREHKFDSEASNIYQYTSFWNMSEEEKIKFLRLGKKVEKLKESNLDEETYKDLLERLIDKAEDKYNETTCYAPRRRYVEMKLKSNDEPQLLNLIKEISDEIEEARK